MEPLRGVRIFDIGRVFYPEMKTLASVFNDL